MPQLLLQDRLWKRCLRKKAICKIIPQLEDKVIPILFVGYLILVCSPSIPVALIRTLLALEEC